VLAKLTAEERKLRHLEVARALVATGAEPEPIALHFRAADETERAAEYAVRAAASASASLAFDRAAELYKQAVELRMQLGQETRSLVVVMGDALAHAGRGAEAASAFLEASEGATAAEALDLSRRAAQQLLVTGHIDQGTETLRAVLASEGMVLPRSPRRALLSVVLHRLWIGLRGVRFTRHDESEISARQLARIDVCWHAGNGLGMADRIKGVVFQYRSLLLALRAGEPRRIARTLAVYAVALAGEGISTARRVEKLLGAAERLARELSDPYTTALMCGSRGGCDYLWGRFRTGADGCIKAEVGFREHCTNVSWELATMRLWATRSLQFLGDFQRLGRWLPLLLQECRDRGDLYGATSLRVSVMPFVWLARDDAACARQEVDEGLRQWSPHGFHIQHYYALYASSSIALYAGELDAAGQELAQKWPAVKGAMLLRVSAIRVMLHELRGRVALAIAAHRPARRAALLAEVDQCARAVERERLPWADALATLLRAGSAHLRTQNDTCISLLERATGAFDQVDMALHAAAARRWLGALAGGEAGDAMRLSAEHAIRVAGITDVPKTAALLAPAFVER
jgi:hypothetical protein